MYDGLYLLTSTLSQATYKILVTPYSKKSSQLARVRKSPLSMFSFVLLLLSLAAAPFPSFSFYDGPVYDSTAYSECKQYPEQPLYDGGILKNQKLELQSNIKRKGVYSPAFVLQSLDRGSLYSFSSWVMINGSNSALVSAKLVSESTKMECIGSVVARSGCWSFLKGGFIFRSSSKLSVIYFEVAEDTDVDISVASVSLQPFTEEQWRLNQQYKINKERKRAVIIHVSDRHGGRLQGSEITVEQISKDFPFGSAIAKTILGNLPYQDWFVKRFNAAVFENELKWYATEPKRGQVNYTYADQMLDFVRANKIIARGHNIFWEDPKYTPPWVLNLTGHELQSAVSSRIESLMSRYKEEFIQWDVSNELLHFDFYERRLGPDATLRFFETVHQADPLATLFFNDFNVIETCIDVKSTVDSYISKVRELRQGGVLMDGIGLEGHFTVPNPPLIRAIVDKLSTLGLPIWFTEIDINKTLSKELQAIYLEQVLREGFSHPSVKGIMLWTALHPKVGCYQMCLTDDDFNNYPSGDVVDKLIKEWQTGLLKGLTDEQGSFSFYGFLGEYTVSAKYGNTTANSTFSLCQSDETKHFNIVV